MSDLFLTFSYHTHSLVPTDPSYQVPGTTHLHLYLTIRTYFPRGILRFSAPKDLEMDEELKTAPPVVETMDASSLPSSPDPKHEHTHDGVTLIPRPSDDPRDPLVSQKCPS